MNYPSPDIGLFPDTISPPAQKLHMVKFFSVARAAASLPMAHCFALLSCHLTA